MSANPNPTYISDAMWALWEGCEANIPGVRLGGIYANKSGYHNTVNANLASWPSSYSVQVAADLDGPFGLARALDLTMDDNQMMLVTGRLRDAANAGDGRIACLRSFIGTTDTWNVDCWIHDYETGAWRYDGGRDDSHLWHVHLSVFTRFCAMWETALEAVLAVVTGGGTYVPPTPIQPGDAPPFPFPSSHYLGQPSSDPACHSGYYSSADNQAVRQWQGQMSARGWSISVDGYYGPGSENVARQFQAEKGLAADGLVGPQTWAMSWTAPVT